MKLRGIVAALAALVLSALPAPAADFGGAYIGLMAGYGLEKLNPPAGGGSFDWASSGMTGGVFAGVGTVQHGVYIGIESDIALRDITAKLGTGGYVVESGADWQGTIRGRVGMPWGPALLYATAGLAVQESKLTVATVGSDSSMLYGMVIGAGIEAQMTRSMFIRLEGRHTRMQDEDVIISGSTATIRHDGETAILGGVGFRF